MLCKWGAASCLAIVFRERPKLQAQSLVPPASSNPFARYKVSSAGGRQSGVCLLPLRKGLRDLDDRFDHAGFRFSKRFEVGQNTFKVGAVRNPWVSIDGAFFDQFDDACEVSRQRVT